MIICKQIYRCHILIQQNNMHVNMYKSRPSNLSQKQILSSQTPMTLNSILRNHVDNYAGRRQIGKVNQIEIGSYDDQNQFDGLIKGLRMRRGVQEKREIGYRDREFVWDKEDQRKEERQRKQQRPSRPRSKKTFVAKNKILVKTKLIDHPYIKVYFRNQVISLMTLLNRRDDFFNNLKAKKNDQIMPMKSSQVEEAMYKLLQMRGRDRGRIKFNFMTNQQLRNLKYKAKPFPMANMNKKAKMKNGDYYDEESQEEQEDQGEGNIDLATWKRRNGCGYNQKVYIVKGGYFELRKILSDKGWFENQDVYSKHFDLKWTTQTCDIDYGNLRNGQVVNHFNNNHHLTSKYGITRRLKTLIVGHGIDIDKFYPRCFDLGDQVDFQNFIENFKFSFVESIAKRFLVDKERYKGLELKVRVVMDILKRKVLNFGEKITCFNNGNYGWIVNSEEWEIVTQTIEWDQEVIKQKCLKLREKDEIEYISQKNIEQNQKITNQDKVYEYLDEKIRKLLEKMDKLDPQLEINGFRNVWIAKPNFLSRGRGIRCLNNLYDIADYCLGKDCQFVIQKYIENPMLIQGKKFDIRQWVLIEDFNPPTIWFYEQCYLRFGTQDYSLENIHNRFSHLTNNSIQKYNKKADIENSMWEMRKFIEYVGEQKWKVIQEKIKNIIVWSIKSCEGHVTGKKGFFEMVGYDFMIDENLNPWIIEVNMSPSMDYSTPVTKKLVKMVQHDMGKFITSTPKKKEKNAGLFTCIYRSEKDLEKYNCYKI